MNAVALRTVPQREKPKKHNKEPIIKEKTSEPDSRSPIQKLMDKFTK